MKKIACCCLTLLAVLLLLPGADLRAKSVDLRGFHRLLRTKNYPQAVRVIAPLSQADPGNGRLGFWYGYALYRTGSYALTVQVMDRPPVHAYNPLSTVYYAAQAYFHLGRNRAAVELLQRGLRLPEGRRKGYRYHFYSLLLKIHEKNRAWTQLAETLRRYSGYLQGGGAVHSGYPGYSGVRALLRGSTEQAKAGRAEAALQLLQQAVPFFGLEMKKYRRYFRPEMPAWAFYNKKQYADVLRAVELIPEQYRSAAAEMLRVRAAYRGGRTEQALVLWRSVLHRYGQRLPYGEWWYAFYMLGNLGRHRELLALEGPVRSVHQRAAKKLPDYIRFRLAHSRLRLVPELVMRGEDWAALRAVREALQLYRRGLGKNTGAVNLSQTVFLEKALAYWTANRKTARPEWTHRFLVVVYSDLDAGFTGFDGRKKQVRDHLPASGMDDYRACLETVRRVFFYMSRGRLDLSFEYKYFPTTVRRVKAVTAGLRTKAIDGRPKSDKGYFHPDRSFYDPHPGQYLFGQRNRYDSFIHVFPSRGLTSTSTGGRGRLQFVPGALSGRVLRGQLTIAGSSFRSYSFRLLVHEFFHTVEGSFRFVYKTPVHIYRPRFRRWWPAWYRGEGELQYYDGVFQRYFNPAGFRVLNFSSRRDPLTDGDLQTALRLSASVPLEQRLQAEALAADAGRRYALRDYRGALQLYRRSWQLYPGSLSVCRRMAWLYARNKERELSRKFYLMAAKLPGAGQSDRVRAARLRTAKQPRSRSGSFISR